MNSPWHVSVPGRPAAAPGAGRAGTSSGPAGRTTVGTRPGGPGTPRRTGTGGPPARGVIEEATGHAPPEETPAHGVTRQGAAWLASAGTYPRTTLTRWTGDPARPLVLPCGVTFDVVNAPAFFGRRMLDQLCETGPGTGPVAVHRGRMLLFAAPGTAQRLPSLLKWEEWGASGAGRGGAVPALLCHGSGDAVTVPPLAPGTAVTTTEPMIPRWLVAPATRRPWLPGPEVLLWACVRAVRTAPSCENTAPAGPVRGSRISIFPRGDQGASVYDVSRRR